MTGQDVFFKKQFTCNVRTLDAVVEVLSFVSKILGKFPFEVS